MNIADSIKWFHTGLYMPHDLKRRFWFKRDAEKYDGTSWYLVAYFLGYGIFKLDSRKTKYRLVNCAKVGVMIEIKVEISQEEKDLANKVLAEAFGKGV